MAKVKERKYSDARKRGQEHGSFQNNTCRLPEGLNWFKVEKAGTRRIDIIPYEVKVGTTYTEPGDLHYEKTFWVHRGIGPNHESYCCPRKNWDKKCPICEYRTKLANDPNADEDIVRDLKPKERQLWYVIDADDPDRGVQLWDVSYHMFGKKMDDYIRDADEDDGYEKFFHLDDGLTVKVGFSEKKYGGKPYFEAATIDFKPRRTAIEESVLEGLPSLDDLLVETAYDKLRKVLEEDEDEEDLEEEIVKSFSGKSKAVAESDEDEEEDPKPARRGRAKPEPIDDDEDELPKKKPAPKEDEDDDPWDDWDEDEKE